jgi:hypothetical protein
VTPEDTIRALLAHVDETAELLLSGDTASWWVNDELTLAWKHAQAQATDAFGEWRRTPGAAAYAAYRAAQDRADAAQDALGGGAS